MTPTEPNEPPGIAQYIVDGLHRQKPGDLRTIAAYAEDLAIYQEAKAEAKMDEQEHKTVQQNNDDINDYPDGVPMKANIVVKEINNNRYEYYQWREDNKIRSQYKCPVHPDK